MRYRQIRTRLHGWLIWAAGAVFATLTLAAYCPAQIDLDTALFGPRNARAEWQQRVLGRSTGMAPGWRVPATGYWAPRVAPGTIPGGSASWSPVSPHVPAGADVLLPGWPNRPAGLQAGVAQTTAQPIGLRAGSHAWANQGWNAQPTTETNVAPAPDPAEIANGTDESSMQIEPIPSPGPSEGPVFAEPGWGLSDPAGCGAEGCAACGVAPASCGPEMVAGCGWGCGPVWRPGLGLGWWLLRRSSVWAGVHGFKGPVDFGRNGNFGIHEGAQIGMPLGGPFGVGVQAGLQAVHSNFEGDQALGQFRNADRNQIFFTTGLFRRAMCSGWQWGVTLDLLHDSYYDPMDLTQIRTELGFVFPSGWELGYWGAYGTSDDTLFVNGQRLGTADPTDVFLFYVRRYLPEGGEARFWAGFSAEGDGLLGGELTVPLGRCWAIENRVGYLIAHEGPNTGAQAEESWGVSMHLVWYPGRPARSEQADVFRPLVPVADNGTLMVDLKP